MRRPWSPAAEKAGMTRSEKPQGVCSARTLFEALGGQSKKMADGARFVRDLQPPFWIVAKPCDGVSDHVRACHCGLVPSRAIIRQIDGHIA
jgi:hypothetical protein